MVNCASSAKGISSVTQGLRQERTALPGLIRALGMDPVRFEDFTALPEPSRDVCLQAAQSSDVYLLLLGDHYGTPFPDTGLSPTHEEYRAALNSGIPVLAFRRRDVAMEPTQVQFAEEVEAYQTGLFRGSWDEVGQLLNAVSGALSNLDALAGRLVFTPDWRSRGRQLADADRRPRPVQWVRPVRTRGVPHAAEHDDARLATAEGW